MKKSTKKPDKPVRAKAAEKRGKLKKFQIRGLGWCGEATAHKLTPAQVKQVKAHASETEESLDGLSGSMEDIVRDYNCYSTNLWQSGTLPFIHATRYALVDSKNKIIYSIEKFENSKGGPKFEIAEKPEYQAAKNRGDVLVFVEEHKGTTAVWEIESNTVPKQSDFVFRLGKLQLDGDDTLYVDSILYKGVELERNYDEEMVVGKAAYSLLL